MDFSSLALVTNGIYPNVIGGMQRHSYYLCKHLAKRGIKIDLYHTTPEPVILANEEKLFDPQERDHILSFYLSYPKEKRYPGHYLKEQRVYSKKVLDNIVVRPDVDFIYTNGITGYELIKHKKRGLPLPPIAVNAHGYEMFQTASSVSMKMKHLLLRPAFKYVTVNADYVLSFGAKISNILAKLGVPNHKIIEIPNGIDSSWLVEKSKANQKVRSFVFIGRYERRKGIEELDKVLEELAGSYQFDFHFIGNIPEKLRLTHKNIIYHGEIKDDQKLKDIVYNCDVLVCPSHSEGMPTVIIEGMARACAIIATDVGAVSLMVDYQNGWLIPPFDLQQLRQAIIQAIKCTDEELVGRKNSSIQRVKERFLWERISLDVIDEISKIKGNLEEFPTDHYEKELQSVDLDSQAKKLIDKPVEEKDEPLPATKPVSDPTNSSESKEIDKTL